MYTEQFNKFANLIRQYSVPKQHIAAHTFIKIVKTHFAYTAWQAIIEMYNLDNIRPMH